MRLRWIGWMGWLVAAYGLAADPAAIEAVMADQPPILDGVLDDACWRRAPANGDFSPSFDATNASRRDTAFRVACDATWLYLGAECRNPDWPALAPIVVHHAWTQKRAYAEEALEFFVDPGSGGKPYFHFILYAANARDQRRVSGRSDQYVDIPWRSATRTHRGGWDAEAAIPLCLLAPFRRGGELRLNVARNRRVPVITPWGGLPAETLETSVWAPPLEDIGGLHETDRFVPVAGIVLTRPPIPFLARILDARLLPYRLENGQPRVALDITMQGYLGATGRVDLLAADRPASGAACVVTQPVTVAGAAPMRIPLDMPVRSLDGQETRLHLRAPGAAELLDTMTVERPADLRALRVFSDRNYYTTESSAVAVCCLGLPPDSLPGLSLEVRRGDGAVLASRSNLAAAVRLAIPLADVPPGVAPLSVVLRDARGADLLDVPLSLVKREPRPGREWKVDRDRRVVLNNGAPFFPFGMIMSGVRSSDTNAFRDLAANAFNTFSIWNRATPDELAAFVRTAGAHGLFVVSCSDGCARPIAWESTARYRGALLEQVKRMTDGAQFPKGVATLPIPICDRNTLYGEFYAKTIDRCLQGVRAVMEFPNLAAHFILDEPMSARQFDEYRFGQDYYARIHRADGYHPVAVNYSSFIPEGDEYVNWCDILMTDPYWSPPAGDDTRSTPNHVSKICWLTDRRAQRYRQAVWQILAAPTWSGCRKRPLNSREIRCQTYLAMIHKAKGIFLFAYSNVRPNHWPLFRALGTEIRGLTPFLVGPDPGIEPRYRRAVVADRDAAPSFAEDPFDPPAERYPAVQAALLRDAAGDLLLLAANSRYYPVACRFEVPGLASVATVAGGKAPDPAADGFRETLEPYAVRAYRLARASAAASLALAVDQVVLAADLPNPEPPRLPSCWRPDRKNLLPNPSLEDAHTEGFPDYCALSPGVSLAAEDALFGRHCLRFENTGARRIESMHMQCAPRLDQPQPHAFSVYLKGDRPGLRAWLRATRMDPDTPHGANRSVELTTDWQRVWITGTIPAGLRDDGDSVFEVRLNDAGVMWLDGLQLERGAEPTAFEE